LAIVAHKPAGVLLIPHSSTDLKNLACSDDVGGEPVASGVCRCRQATPKISAPGHGIPAAREGTLTWKLGECKRTTIQTNESPSAARPWRVRRGGMRGEASTVDDGVGCIDGGNGSSVLHDHDAPLLPILLLETISVAPRKSPLLWAPLLDSLALRLLLRTHCASCDGPPRALPGVGGKGRTDNTREGSPSIPESPDPFARLGLFPNGTRSNLLASRLSAPPLRQGKRGAVSIMPCM
jgi:hypothetical protein